jgi:hypothetical protein
MLLFPQPRPVAGVRFSLWTDHYTIEMLATRSNGAIVRVRAHYLTGLPPESFEVMFDDTIPDVVRLDLHIGKRGDVHIHMREIEILP